MMPTTAKPTTTSPSTQAMLDLLAEQNKTLANIKDLLEHIAANTAPAGIKFQKGNGHTAPPAQPSTAPANPPAGPVQSFKAATLEGSVTGGKAYWKVKGGPFTKFGVTIWPEVLAMHTKFANIQAGSVIDLAGWTAEYINKADGKPDKVVRLIPPGFAGEDF